MQHRTVLIAHVALQHGLNYRDDFPDVNYFLVQRTINILCFINSCLMGWWCVASAGEAAGQHGAAPAEFSDA